MKTIQTSIKHWFNVTGEIFKMEKVGIIRGIESSYETN